MMDLLWVCREEEDEETRKDCLVDSDHDISNIWTHAKYCLLADA